MREGIGSTFLYNIIIIFVIIAIGLLSATISYYKAFKVNERLLYSIDKFEGYNSFSKKEMENYLANIGYTYEANGQSQCASTKGGDGPLVTSVSSKYLYCVYYHTDDRGNNEKNRVNGDKEPIYYNYSLVTYIYVNLPIVGKFKVPVYTKGERIYNFSDHQSQGARV